MKLSEADFTHELCERLIAEHILIEKAAQAIAPDCVGYKDKPVSWRTVKVWISRRVGPRARAAARGLELAERHDPEKLNRIAELLAKNNIDPDNIGSLKSARVKSWGYAMKLKDADGNETPHEGGLFAVDALLSPIAPDFPLVQPAPTTTINYVAPPRILRKTRTELVISDIQAGFLRDIRTEVLEPIHDLAALDVAYQITADIRPQRLIFIGDLADLSCFSRWAQHPEYRGTLQASIDAVHEICGTFIACAGKKAERIVIGSNHDHRIEKSVLEWNKEAMGLRRASVTDGWPVFSLGFLARFDDLELKWSGQFPAGEFYILPDLVAMHAPPKSKEFGFASVIHGHTHKVSRTPYMSHTFEGRKPSFVYDCGCLCRVGVTDDKYRLLVTQTPSDRGRTDWHQGVLAINVVEATGSRPATHSVDQISIRDGQAIYGGKVYDAAVSPAA